MAGRRPKLTADQVREVRAWAAQRVTVVAKARELGVSPRVLRAWIAGDRKRWQEATP